MTSFTTASQGTVSPSFICPITQDIMFDPVLDMEGNSFERSALERWLIISPNKVSPVSKQPLSVRFLIPNRSLRDVIHSTMGKEWEEKRRKQIEATLPSPPETTALSPPRSQAKSSHHCWYRRVIDYYLDILGNELNIGPLSLNESGVCVFRLASLPVIVEVPTDVGFVFWYSSIVRVDKIPDEMKDIMLKLNFFQTETRGGCLSMQKLDSKTDIIFSYRDRVTEINLGDFFNIIYNFVQIALKLRYVLLTPEQEEDVIPLEVGQMRTRPSTVQP
mmetsp:Transcript_41305/g.61147  ORF Transcript_41305/g.61147 Transcript_41305/m.61147 type:complete len:275 (-) Transcript_41305:83-907(-)|eukprot:CAMPEP_0194047944 /NCGR_PEP_ID=MMETSP0009_2-20130614/26310_1 /TAXON_ID=210454 /ORGANISM="Grammatophora oceanica, Strain CCMP 410" /LENGTH=274 /DNA_ID=CAMNT_0038693713 /DNA_START=155 /DNA_END=979 /DNA_ORIENTATION=-